MGFYCSFIIALFVLLSNKSPTQKEHFNYTKIIIWMSKLSMAPCTLAVTNGHKLSTLTVSLSTPSKELPNMGSPGYAAATWWGGFCHCFDKSINLAKAGGCRWLFSHKLHSRWSMVHKEWPKKEKGGFRSAMVLFLQYKPPLFATELLLKLLEVEHSYGH